MKRESFSDTQKLKEFFTTRPALQEMPKGVLQIERMLISNMKNYLKALKSLAKVNIKLNLEYSIIVMVVGKVIIVLIQRLKMKVLKITI